MKKPKIKIIEMDILPWDICFAIGATEKEVSGYLKKHVKYILDSEERSHLAWDNNSNKGRTIQLKNNAVIMWIRKKDMAVLAHESLHAATFILERAGLKFSQDSDEMWAYMIERIFREAVKIF